MLSRLKKASDTIGHAIAAAPAAGLVRELARKNYTPRSTHYSLHALDRAFDRHVDDIKPGARVFYDLAESTPKGETFMDRASDVLNNSGYYASSSAAGQDPGISINPKASREIFAHELGHLASQQTDVGHLVSSLRHNPKLKKALLGAMLTLPGAAAVLEAGNDDMDSSLALALAASAPTMIDEGLATMHGLDIMNKGGMRATLGQRGRLAGGLLSYMAAPVALAVGGNVVGNMLD